MAGPLRAPRVALAAALLLASPAVLAGFAGTDVVIPASARLAGAPPAQFYSTLWITNPGAATANVEARFLRLGESNTAPPSRTLALAPGETKKYENVVEQLFGIASGAGAIRVLADREVIASSRTYDLPPGASLRDAKGLFFSGIPRDLAIGLGETSTLQGVSQGASEDFRYNFGLVEVSGSAATVRVQLLDAAGATLASKDYAVRAWEPRQLGVTDLLPAIATANARLVATVVSGGGKVLFYGTGIANGSQDSIGFEMSFRSALLAGGVASLNGLTGALTLAAGANVTITPSGSTLTVSASLPSGGLTLPFAGSAANGIAAFSVANPGAGTAVLGTRGAASGTTGTPPGGVTGDSRDGAGVAGTSLSGSGVVGFSATRGGVVGISTADGGAGLASAAVTGLAQGPAENRGLAAFFSGNVEVSGAVSKGGGSFKIDHPLDPENEYLYHSFVESPEMMNVYAGTAILDARGEAVVELPRYFEALNRDVRYQLTCVGGWAPVYVASEVAANRFRVAGGRPGLKVSWQVTGVRQDAWAEAHRIPVEERKPESERGTYRYPEEHGQPASKGVAAARPVLPARREPAVSR